MTSITEAEFGEMLATFRHSAFRLEAQPFYALDYERPDYESFMAGQPVRPMEIGWWRPWLEQVARLTAAGKSIGRVRILEEPPTTYQRWLMEGDRWHLEAGEDIRHITRSRAQAIGLPDDGDWWLLDDARLIRMGFSASGEITGKELITDARTLEHFTAWRDLAISHAIPAGASTPA